MANNPFKRKTNKSNNNYIGVSLQNINLLVISDGFPYKNSMKHNYVKAQLDYIKYYLNRIYVIAVIPYLPKLLNSVKFFPHKWKRKEFKNYKYDNIEVYYLKYFHLPIKYFRDNRSYLIYSLVKSFLKKKEISFDLIHAHFTNSAGVIAYKLSKKLNIPYVLTVHENRDWLLSEIAQNKKLFKNTWKYSSKIIRVNSRDLHILKKFNNNIISIPNGFDHKIFKKMNKSDCRYLLNIPQDTKVIVNIGFYKEHKGQKYLIEAISKLPAGTRNKLRCYIIGGGPLLNKLKRQIQNIKLEGVVYLIGQIDQEKLPLWLNSADIFCLSSISEGNPTVMFEALGCGVPFVGTDVGGIPEIITSNKLGLLSPKKDVLTLARNLNAALQMEWDYKFIESYSRRFTWDSIASKIVRQYDLILS